MLCIVQESVYKSLCIFCLETMYFSLSNELETSTPRCYSEPLAPSQKLVLNNAFAVWQVLEPHMVTYMVLARAFLVSLIQQKQLSLN